ncbi:DUF742 domain-containing protein [Actinomadura rudentiformis]|uniref:DUF742 domain-containing protein n=1 Tax=Actinomadura rudentiformis TaxID=359158 RepID=A0A6H9YMD7_9ACTN|nr:DUF742 domain-containing protein [Actinomadura rudentiformis]KAB2343303.1 DUF742 domain-containing protein [Actinomadura rudentiformis]
MSPTEGPEPGERPGADGSAWFDDDAGPVVRPYALTGGRTHYDGGDFDLVALIVTRDAADAGEPDRPGPLVPHVTGPPNRWAPDPEHEMILELCRSPLSVVEVASELELPLGVVRVLLGDLLDRSLILVRRPAPVAQFPSERVLKEVIDGIRAL